MANKSIYKKILVSVRDEKFEARRQSQIISVVNAPGATDVFVNQYGKVFTSDDIGDFDVEKSGGEGSLKFISNDGRQNDYSFAFTSFDNVQDITLDDELRLASAAAVGTYHTTVSGTNAGISTHVFWKLPSTDTSYKIHLSVSSDQYNQNNYEEISLINTGSGVFETSYGKLFSGSGTVNGIGIGTIQIDQNGTDVDFKFVPVSGYTTPYQINANLVSIASTSTNINNSSEPYQLKYAELEGGSISIGSSATPTATIIDSIAKKYQAAYYVVQVVDLTYDRVYMSEITTVCTAVDADILEFAEVFTGNPLDDLGTFDVVKSDSMSLRFTPNPNLDVEVSYFRIAQSIFEDTLYPELYDFGNGTVTSGISRFGFAGTGRFRTQFNLLHKNLSIFRREFDGSNTSIVDLTGNSILMPNHYFVTGERVQYYSDSIDTTKTDNNIGVAQTNSPGIGLTTKLPEFCFVYKQSDSRIQLCATAADALAKPNPRPMDLTSVGVSTIHNINATKQNTRALIDIDNIIQAPVVGTSRTTNLFGDIDVTDQSITLDDITGFYANDLIEVDDEIMKVSGVSKIKANTLTVIRPQLGTILVGHSSDAQVVKMTGNYNIIRNQVNFSQPPYGPVPETDANNPDEVDRTDIQTKSTFQGRVFMRTAEDDGTVHTYDGNKLFDNISEQFTGIQSTFTLKSDASDVTGISTYNALLMVNNIIQQPGENYNLIEDGAGTKTDLKFTGIATGLEYDVNRSPFPKGGVIVSASSTFGMGYQPLVSAGGTAIISGLGTVSSVSIGNTGSGYRAALQVVNVGVQTYSSGTPNIFNIGTAVVSGGHVVSVAITNPGTGYTFSDPPEVIFDDPNSYENLDLIYAHGNSGNGSAGKIDIVVGAGTSVTRFDIENQGYSYLPGDKLTVQVGGVTGIPTYSATFNDFELTVDETYVDSFASWWPGQLQPLDDISDEFNGSKTRFNLTKDGERFAIIARKGSLVDTKFVLLIFINDVLQVPDTAYEFSNGSTILFSEPPREGDTFKALFYRGTPDLDVKDIDILETIKRGDKVQVNSDTPSLIEDDRTVYNILAPDVIETNVYDGAGVVNNPSLQRPVSWIKQREDVFIDGAAVAKNRINLEPELSAVANLIQPVTTGSTQAYVDSIRTFFDNEEEDISDKEQKIVEIIDSTPVAFDTPVKHEKAIKCVYDGDFGNIVGIRTGFVGANFGIFLDTFIPMDSRFRNTNIVGTAKTVSTLEFEDYLVVKGSNSGPSTGTTSFRNDNSNIGVGTEAIDNIYQVLQATTETGTVTGIGSTAVRRVFVKCDTFIDATMPKFGDFYGAYSWGEIDITFREEANEFPAYFSQGIVGIDTSPVVRRMKPLKFLVP